MTKITVNKDLYYALKDATEQITKLLQEAKKWRQKAEEYRITIRTMQYEIKKVLGEV